MIKYKPSNIFILGGFHNDFPFEGFPHVDDRYDAPQAMPSKTRRKIERI